MYFKMEGLHCLTGLLRPDDFMVKIDMKDAFFSIALNKSSRRLVSFQWEAKIYEFQVLCFGLAPAPLTFTKIAKVPISLL